MSKYYYKKNTFPKKRYIRLFALAIFLMGFFSTLYIIFPVISWQVYFAPVFASNELTTPIPRTTVVNPLTIKSLFAEAGNTFSGLDFSNAQNWFPQLELDKDKIPSIESYTITIPKLTISDAFVTTVDYNLSEHLVNYGGTAIPPQKGTSVIFGHSTLPQLFNASDYKTIFANAYTLKNGDEFSIKVRNVEYKYKIFSVTVVDSNDTSMFDQNYDNSYITLITCTPPGTTWKRLVIKARLEEL